MADAERVVDQALEDVIARPDVQSALAVVLDARDGRIVAMQSLGGGTRDPELPARERRSHGSVGKTFTYAIALDRGAITTTERLDGAPVTLGADTVRDREDRSELDLEEAFAVSSNVAAVRAFERLGRADLVEGLRALHLDAATPADAASDEATAARVAYGPGLVATPLEIASALAAVVNGGAFHAPWREGQAPSEPERVLSPATSDAMRALLESAVTRDDGTGHLAAVEGTRVGGKTGTMPLASGTHGCFAGAVPMDDPAFVIVVDVVVRGEGYSGGTVAAPVFAQIADALVSR